MRFHVNALQVALFSIDMYPARYSHFVAEGKQETKTSLINLFLRSLFIHFPSSLTYLQGFHYPVSTEFLVLSLFH
jgi:hypothetical protein